MHHVEPNPQTGLLVRKAGLKDIADVVTLLETLGHPSNPEAVSRHIRRAMERNSDGDIMVAELAGAIVGFVAFQRMDALPYPDPWLRITAICVSSGYRGKGIGQMLETAAVDAAVHKDCAWIELTTSHHRTDAHRFYTHNGYQDTHRCFTKFSAANFFKEFVDESKNDKTAFAG